MNVNFLKPAIIFSILLSFLTTFAENVSNPVIWADIPDPSIVRVGSEYYMSHTTMHMAPGVPIMKSTDLVNWRTVGYAYSTLVNNDDMNLDNGKNAYSRGSWASSIRYKDGTFHVLTFSYTSGKTHLYSTNDIEAGPWEEIQFPSVYHDPSLHLDEDGRNYIVYGASDIRIVELNSDLSGIKAGGLNKILIPDAQHLVGDYILNAEGAHIEKINDWYYVFLICWPSSGYDGRTELVYRSRTIDGTYEGKVVHSSKGVAQGSVIQAEDGSWWGYLFQDNGAVGRCPWIMPVTWENDWPVFNGGVSPTTFTIPTNSIAGTTGIVTSDDFSSPTVKLEWQWNHNPDNVNWSLTERPGFYRIKTSSIDAQVVNAKNSLTQRSFGPKCSGRIAVVASGMKDGDIAGLCAFQYGYGYVGVKKSGTDLSVVMVNAGSGTPTEVASASINQDRVYLRVDMDFTNRTDKATFFYSLDSLEWNSLGNTLQMSYDLKHFTGYRFALFNYATKSAGGQADFDWFQIGSSYTDVINIDESGFKLSVQTNGQGEVSRSPNSSSFEEGTSVTLTAQPQTGWEFNSWSGSGISGSDNPLTITMDEDKNITALFTRSTIDENLVLNGDFSSGFNEWTLNVWSGSATGIVVNGEYQFSIGSAAINSYDIQLIQSGLFLQNGQTYRVTFDAYAASNRTMEVNVEMADDPWTSYLQELRQFDLTTLKQTYTFTFTMDLPTDINGRLGFNVGTATPAVYIDNVSAKVFDPTSVTFAEAKSQFSAVKINCINSALRIEFAELQKNPVTLKIYNLKGDIVRTAYLRTGVQREYVNFDLSNMPTGFYIAKISSKGNGFNSSRILLIR